MEWLNLHTSILDSEEFVGEDPTNQATWLKLMRYCCGQENGGRLRACKAWKDRKWQQLVRVTQEEIQAASDLWTWEGDDLLVEFYPLQKEAEVRAKRENGKKGGRPPKETSAETETEPQGYGSGNQSGTASPESSKTEGKGMEGNGMEGRGKATPAPAHFKIPEDPAPAITKTTGARLQEIEANVRKLAPGWHLPLGSEEGRRLLENMATLEALTPEEWQTLREFLNARLPAGSKYWQPRSRSRFLENVADVWTHAASWQRKERRQKPKPATVAPFQPQPMDDDAKAALAELVKTAKGGAA